MGGTLVQMGYRMMLHGLDLALIGKAARALVAEARRIKDYRQKES